MINFTIVIILKKIAVTLHYHFLISQRILIISLHHYNSYLQDKKSSKYAVVNDVIKLIFDENLKQKEEFKINSVNTKIKIGNTTLNLVSHVIETVSSDKITYIKFCPYKLEYKEKNKDNISFINDYTNNIIIVGNDSCIYDDNSSRFGYLILNNKIYMNTKSFDIDASEFNEKIYDELNNMILSPDYKYLRTEAVSKNYKIGINSDNEPLNLYKIYKKFLINNELSCKVNSFDILSNGKSYPLSFDYNLTKNDQCVSIRSFDHKMDLCDTIEFGKNKNKKKHIPYETLLYACHDNFLLSKRKIHCNHNKRNFKLFKYN